MALFGLAMLGVGRYESSLWAQSAGTRDKSGAAATLQTDGRWSVEGGNTIVRSSVKLYRNGLRQKLGLDYALDPANPHFFRPLGDPWDASDVVLMDYLY